jgi:hypothetical protein
MTVMSWGNSEGTKGRCDAKCHNATTPHCDCMCGGRYHGAGRDGSLGQRIEAYGEEVLEAARARAKTEGFELKATSIAELFAQAALPLGN